MKQMGLVLVVVFGMLVPASAEARQTGGAVLTGVATDATGAPLADAVAELFGAARRTARTLDDGRFTFEGLPAGAYRLLVTRADFATQELPLTLASAERRELQVSLTVAGVAEFVETVSKVREDALRTPFMVSEVPGEDLRNRGALTFEEALRSVPGLQHGTQGNAFTRVATRGLRDTADVLVVLDGVPFRQLNGSADLTMLPVAAMESIEFIKGPASSMYGRSAIGGVMQVFTVPARSSAPSGEARLGYSSFNTRELNGNLQLPWRGGRLAGVTAISRADGVQARTGRDATFGSVTADHGVSHAQLRFQYLFSDVDAGRGSIIPLQDGRPLYGITRKDNAGIPGARFEGTLHSATQHTDVDLGRGAVVTNAFNFNRYDRFSTGGITIVPAPTASNKGWSESTARQDTLINELMFRWDTGTATVRGTLQAGLTAEHGSQNQDAPVFTAAPTYRGPDYVTPVPGATALNDPRGIRGATVTSVFEQTIVSAYLQERLEHGRVAGVIGFRWDTFDQSLERTDTSVVSADSRSRVSPRLGLDMVALQRAHTEVAAFANWIEGFRPQFPALSTQSGVTVPQLLRPEVTRSGEAGVKVRSGVFSGQVGAFNMRKIDGQRSFRSGPDDFTFVNATTRVRGVELEGRVRASKGLAVWAHYAFHAARHIEFRPTLTTSFAGYRLRMAPRQMAGAGATLLLGRVTWSANVAFVGARPLRDNVVNPQMLASYTTVDASAGVPIGRTRLVLFGTNLTDAFYIGDDFSSQDAGNPGPPRRVGAQVEVRF